jgi:hypothetical protein
MFRTFFTDLRKFILKLGLFLQMAGFVFLRKHPPVYRPWVAGGLVFLIMALAFPGMFRFFLEPLQCALKKLSHWWGRVVTAFILAMVYFLAVVPLGLTAKLFRKEFLALRFQPHEASYWIPRKKGASGKSAHEHQY